MSQNKQKLLAALRKKVEYQKFNKIEFFRPYQKQVEFFNAGKTHRERLLMAGNQLGKTLGAGAECTYHLTGEYPEWWEGKRFDHPVVAWVAGESGESTRDNPQRILIGRPGEDGTGMIPQRCLGRKALAKGVADLIDHIDIKHVSGGISHLYFKSYGKGREKWQGETIDFVWFDEEPPELVYNEGITRTNAAPLGPVMITFTPLKGVSRVVAKFVRDDHKDRDVTSMTIWDVVKEPHSHYTKEQAQQIIDSYPEYERKARTEGIPMLGEGAVFTVDEERIKEEPFDIPPHWPRVAAIDFGWDHPTAVVWIAHDKVNDVVHVYGTHKQEKQLPIMHAAAINARGRWIPVAWPLDGLQTEKGSGKTIKDQYVEQKVNMMFQHAQYDDDRGNFVEPGITDIFQRMETDRFKVFSNLKDWFEEMRGYHRVNGQVKKEFDDLMDATRYAVMSLRFAKTQADSWEFAGDIKYPNMGIV